MDEQTRIRLRNALQDLGKEYTEKYNLALQSEAGEMCFYCSGALQALGQAIKLIYTVTEV